MTQETEIKIALGQGMEQMRGRVEALGFRIHKARVFERNLVFDKGAAELKGARQLLRLRDAGGQATLTYKGVPQDGGRHKSREERETQVSDCGEMRVILERLGYGVTFIYEKYRTEYQEADGSGTVTLDETPAGDFMELEGAPEWIDATARRLDLGPGEYLTTSYGRIYAEWCERSNITPGDMVFPASH